MKYTVITINFNNRDGLKRTLDSVRNQSGKQFEYIVIDGGSTDGSLDVIKENNDIIDKWVSEPDRGIYNAMNKGVERASGEFCLFLNSGDCFHSMDVMERMESLDLNSEIFFGQVLNIYPNGKKELYRPSGDMTLMRIIQTGIHHAGSFISTELMRRYPYDESLKICSDRKFFVQALIIDNCEFSILDFPVCDFELGGISYVRTDLASNESWQIMEELLPPRLVADYRKTNFQIQQMTSQLVKYRFKIISFVCMVNKLIIKLSDICFGKKAIKST